MKILYDHQIFTQQQYGGISRYFFELVRNFDGIQNSCEVATLYSNNAYYNDEFNPQLNKFLPKSHFKGKTRITNYLNKKKSLDELKKENFNVFHPTYYDDYFLSNIKNKPFVVTFYDMIHEKFCNQFESLKLDTKLFDNKRRLLERANKIIAISETTKKDIIEIFDVDENMIDVVYLGSSLENLSIINEKIIKEDYILFVGNRSIYKNFNFFISSVADLLLQSHLKLVCAGGGDFTIEEEKLIASLGLENLVISKKIINDDVLSNFYKHALFFVFPSLYEGFGIPVLEAFACDCPILLSDGGSLKEVGGDAALYFDPTNEYSLRNAINELIGDESLRKNLKQKAKIRLNEFSWNKTFDETLEVYKSIM